MSCKQQNKQQNKLTEHVKSLISFQRKSSKSSSLQRSTKSHKLQACKRKVVATSKFHKLQLAARGKFQNLSAMTETQPANQKGCKL
jgi:hypothetical protein